MHERKTGEHTPIRLAPGAILAVKAEGVREKNRKAARLWDHCVI